jgi:lipopolysaccharide heptosyltransferase I
MTLPRRILIVRPSALGDVCRSVPVLASVRAAMPEAHIGWLVQDDFAAAIEAHPALNEVIAFPRNRFAGWWKGPARANEMRRWLADLRRKHFDVALDCQGLSRSGLIARLSGASLRAGLRSAREFAWLFYNHRVPDKGAPLPKHTVDQMLCVLQPLNIPPVRDMRLYVSPQHQTWWQAEGDRMGLGATSSHQGAGDPYAILAPGSRWPSKRWPIERFADLVEPLLRRGFARVIVTGASSERPQIQPLLQRFGLDATGSASARNDHPVIDMVGRTSIGQTMAIIAGAGLVIANDSAPLHMAVGFDRPCIALFGPTDPAEVGPYGMAECVVRAYQPSRQDGAASRSGEARFKDASLGDSLMRLISTSMVLQSIDRVLALWPTRSSSAPAREPMVEFPQRVRPASAGPPLAGGDPSRTRGLEPEAAS